MMLRFGPLVVGLLAATGLADLTMRFLPVDPFTFRGWEAVRRFRISDEFAFEANRTYRNARAFGDLANLGNMRDHREYRPEAFTTDHLGFRNVPAGQAQEPPTAVVIGDSFAVGAGVSDEDTLAAQLGALTGRRVYNAGGLTDYPPARVGALMDELSMRRGRVIWLYTELGRIPRTTALQGPPRTVADWDVLKARRRGIVEVSPLRIVATQAMRVLENDRILPNPYAKNAVLERLRNGDVMLFQPAHVAAVYPEEPLLIERFAGIRDELGSLGLDLLVVLVPRKYTVYGRWSERASTVPDRGLRFLETLERGLGEQGIPAVNLAPRFVSLAETIFAQRVYLYFRDDNHWNARGIGAAADAILGAPKG